MIRNNPTLIHIPTIPIQIYNIHYPSSLLTSHLFLLNIILKKLRLKKLNIQILQQFRCYLNKGQKNSFYMHNPSYKSYKHQRIEFYHPNTYTVARQLLDPVNLNSRNSKNIKSVGNKDRFLNRIQEINEELTFLKVNGRQINSGIYVDDAKMRFRTKQNTQNKFLMEPIDKLVTNVGDRNIKEFKRFKQRQQKNQKSDITKSHPNILTDHDISQQDDISSPDQIALPELVQKDIVLMSNLINDRKVMHKSVQKQSQRQNYTIVKYSKRRETVIESTVNGTKDRNSKNQQSSKNQQQFKKILNFQLYREFLMTINLTNRLIIHPDDDAQYKVFICKGNNGLLVKSIIKTRPWWSFRNINDIDSCHLVWTQWKRNKSINLLPQKQRKISVKGNFPDYQPSIKSTNKILRQKAQKKIQNFSKIIGKNNNLFQKYEQTLLNENYLSFSNKISSKAFEQVSQKHLSKEQYNIYPKQIEKRLVNHIPGCLYLHSKRLLFLSISKYYQKLNKDVFSVIPVTFMITNGINDPEFDRFCKYYEQLNLKNKNQKGNIWICKPGQNSNRGNGIQVVSTLSEIKSLVGSKCGASRTLIIQKYMENPFLYNKRKFDIRCYILITCVNGVVKGYWYQEGYVRTTSRQYTLKNLQNKLIHLTNDAIQKKGQQYGKFQNFNKVSFGDLQKYIQTNTDVKFKSVYDGIKAIAADLIISVARKMNPHYKQFTFEVFGLDFMLDDKLTPYLIQANSNPCLQVDGNVLARVIPPMIQNVIRVAIDPIFPPPYSESTRSKFSPGNIFQSNRMVLVYDSLYDYPRQQVVEVADAAQQECQQFEGQVEQQ